jgi:hypothetical protein
MAMSQSVLVRFALPVAILVILACLYIGLSGPSQTLLSVPSPGFVGVTMLVVVGLAGFAGYMLAKDIPSRLGRRLVLLLVMAFSIYAGGVDARGLYAVNAFDGQPEPVTERWMTMKGKAGEVVVTSLERRKTIDLAATPDAIDAAGPGKCVSLQIERSSAGAERIAPSQPEITVADLRPC